MVRVSLYEAKRRLSALLERARNGERITITKHGVPIAELGPAGRGGQRMTPDDLREAFRRLSEGIRLGPDLTIKQLIEEGRR